MRLKELREEKNYTQWDIAHGINTNQRNISRWENGEVLPSSEFVIKLADFFGVSTDYLLGRSDDFGFVTSVASPSLSREDRDLLELYHSLPNSYQELAMKTLRSWAGTSKPSAKSKIPHT